VVGGRNNDVCVISEFYKLVARIHCSEVTCSYHICRWPNGGALDNAGCYFLQCGGLIVVDQTMQWECSVKNSASQLYTCADISSWAILSRRVECRMESNTSTKVQRDDNYILVMQKHVCYMCSRYMIAAAGDPVGRKANWSVRLGLIVE